MAAMGEILKLCSLFFVIYSAQCADYQPGAIKLDEDSWQDILEGQWMVEFMAPWCPACRAFTETWDGFAKKWSRDLDVKVGVVDVTQSPGLSGRFLITALPSIYHVKNGVFRQYKGGRTESDLITFIDDKHWQDVEPVSKWTSPDSIQMGFVGMFFKVAMKIRAFYSLMTEVYGIPEWGCYVIFAVITIAAGLLLGLLLVCLCDFVSPARQYPPPIPQELMHPDIDKEGDILDDTLDDKDADGSVRKRNIQKTNDKSDDKSTDDNSKKISDKEVKKDK